MKVFIGSGDVRWVLVLTDDMIPQIKGKHNRELLRFPDAGILLGHASNHDHQGEVVGLWGIPHIVMYLGKQIVMYLLRRAAVGGLRSASSRASS